ncbi:hypothetical protein Hanom_Chr16g01426981 [Helianthus anomalus]
MPCFFSFILFTSKTLFFIYTPTKKTHTNNLPVFPLDSFLPLPVTEIELWRLGSVGDTPQPLHHTDLLRISLVCPATSTPDTPLSSSRFQSSGPQGGAGGGRLTPLVDGLADRPPPQSRSSLSLDDRIRSAMAAPFPMMTDAVDASIEDDIDDVTMKRWEIPVGLWRRDDDDEDGGSCDEGRS